MKENGSITKLKGKELSGMQRVIFTQDNLRQIRRMGLECTLTSMARDMKENGSMMFKRDKAKRLGLMEPSTSANIEMV